MRRTVPVNAASGICCLVLVSGDFSEDGYEDTFPCGEPAVQAILEVEDIEGVDEQPLLSRIVEIIETRCEAHKEENG